MSEKWVLRDIMVVAAEILAALKNRGAASAENNNYYIEIYRGSVIESI